jgi:hypothetical protein
MGANAGRDRAWKALTSRGFRGVIQGVAMHRPNDPGYNSATRTSLTTGGSLMIRGA